MKAQSAFELITTYGWVLATVITIAGLLVYLNYTNPNDFLEEDCQIDKEFSCLDYGIIQTETNTSVLLTLRNRNYEPLQQKSYVVMEFKDNVKQVFPAEIMPGEVFSVAAEGSSQGWKAGQKKKVNFKIVYYTNITSPNVPKVSSGHIYAEVK